MMRATDASKSLQVQKRWYPAFSNYKLTARIPVGAVALFLSLFCEKGIASTGSSWSQKPAWADDSSASHHSARSHDQSYSDVAPFTPGSHNIAVDLGQVFLMGDLAKYTDTIGAQLHYTYGVSDLFAFDTSFGFSSHSGGQLSMLTLLPGMRLNMSWYDKVVPYAILGMGFYKPSYRVPPGTTGTTATATADDSISSILFGLHVGPGVDLELSRNLFFGAALTFHHMFGTTQTLANGTPFNIGGTYTSFFLHIGATF